MNRLIYILIVAFGLLSCNDRRTSVTIQTNGKIVIIDSSAKSQNLYEYQPNFRYGYYPIYYIGELVDTIYLGQKKINRSSYNQENNKLKNFTWADSTKLKLFVDTSFSLTHTEYYTHYAEKEKNEVIDSTKSYKTFPLFVYNLSDSLLSLGKFSELGHTVKQAKDDQGNWIDIEMPIRYGCGTGARNIILKPHQMLIAKIIRSKGDYKTECRLKYSRWEWTIYSNTFNDYIDKRQLTDTLLKESLHNGVE